MTDTTKYRARLEEEKARLEGELSTVGRRNPSNPEDWEATATNPEPEPDPNDRADQMAAYSVNSAILTDLENRYNEVKDALARMDDGSYGTCRICGNAIEEDRLGADASADTCKEHIDQ
jgi:RNA polymerase-binding transcription factor DksA